MDDRRMRGEGRMGGIISLLVVAAAGYCAWNAGPAYMAHYELKDKMQEVARAPRAGNSDDKLLESLEKYLKQETLYPMITRANFRVFTAESSRRITVTYVRKVKFLPGVERDVNFEATVEGTLLF